MEGLSACGELERAMRDIVNWVLLPLAFSQTAWIY